MLIYEFLVRKMSMDLVEGRDEQAKVSLNIIKKYFKPGTELYKEYRLADSLAKATVSSSSVAASIISEAKRAARSHDVKKLNEEKFRLLNEINSSIQDQLFWDRPVPLYKTLATIQTLINDWRKDPRDIDLVRLAEYEEQVSSWLQENKSSPKKLEEMKGNPGEDRLLLRIMSKKLEEKYSSVLSPLQKTILKEYVLVGSKDLASSKLSSIIEQLITSLEKRIDEYVKTKSSHDYEVKKLISLKEGALRETLSLLSSENDESWFANVMDFARLHDELGKEE